MQQEKGETKPPFYDGFEITRSGNVNDKRAKTCEKMETVDTETTLCCIEENAIDGVDKIKLRYRVYANFRAHLSIHFAIYFSFEQNFSSLPMICSTRKKQCTTQNIN